MNIFAGFQEILISTRIEVYFASGLISAFIIWICYRIAIRYENPSVNSKILGVKLIQRTIVYIFFVFIMGILGKTGPYVQVIGTMASYYIASLFLLKIMGKLLHPIQMSILISAEILIIAILALGENHVLFSTAIICIFGKWFWLDSNPNDKKQYRQEFDKFRTQEPTNGYCTLYAMVLIITLAFKVIMYLCFSYIVTALSLLLGIIIVFSFATIKKKLTYLLRK